MPNPSQPPITKALIGRICTFHAFDENDYVATVVDVQRRRWVTILYDAQGPGGYRAFRDIRAVLDMRLQRNRLSAFAGASHPMPNTYELTARENLG